MGYKLVVTEKPSVARAYADALGVKNAQDGYIEGNGYIISWCVGHLIELAQPDSYDPALKKWSYNSLPIMPGNWQYEIKKDTKAQFKVLKKLMHDKGVDETICATDAGREGELIFRLVYEQAGCDKPIKRLWLSSMEESAIREGFANLKPGYMYNDLCQLVGDKQVLIFPSGYKRDIKYGQIDAPNEILRTEVLNRWYDDPEVHWVVTYPEAMAERVRRREDVEASTVQLRKGCTADLTEIAARLRELGFTATDYVYEPGQFSVRGSILDVFSYSNELPYRIDFWGDDIDSIRTFNVETQLSEEQLDQVSILNNSTSGGGREDNVSLLDYIGDDTIVLCRSEQWLTTRIGEIAREGMSVSAIIRPTKSWMPTCSQNGSTNCGE